MTTMSVLAMIAEAAGDGGGSGAAPTPFPMSNMVILIVGFFAIVYFMSIRPQRRQQKEHKDMISKLKAGDKVVTIGCICGEIFQVKDDSFVLKIDEKTKMEVTKGGIRAVTSQKEGSDSKKDDEKA